MNELIARRYVKALMECLSKDELKGFLNPLGRLSSLYASDKFQLIIQSPDVNKNEKLELVMSIFKDKNEKIENFIKLLGENDRLTLIPYINDELKEQVLNMENIYKGVVLSNFEMDKEDLKKLEDSFSKKFGGSVEFECKKSDYPGIKIELDTLGVEASFSIERLKAQIAEHILKAI